MDLERSFGWGNKKQKQQIATRLENTLFEAFPLLNVHLKKKQVRLKIYEKL